MRYSLRTLLIAAAIGPPAVAMYGLIRKLDFVDKDFYFSLLLLWIIASAAAIHFTFNGIGWLLRRAL